MTDTLEKVKQLAPHWAVMLVLMFGLLAVVESVFGALPFWQSLILVLLVAIGYPFVVRSLGVAPEVWERQ